MTYAAFLNPTVTGVTPVVTNDVTQQAGFDLGGIFTNALNQGVNLLGQWGAWEVQAEIASEIADIQNIQNQVATGQAVENNVPADAGNPPGFHLPTWAPTAMIVVGGLAALAIVWRVVK